MYLLTICIYSLEKYLVETFAQVTFKSGYLIFLLLSCRSSLDILDINPLSDR